METEPQEVLEQEPSEPTGEVETPVETVEGEAESVPAEEPAPEPKGAAKETPDTVQKRIDEITWQKYDAQRERDYWKMQAEKNLKEEPQSAPETAPFTLQPPRQEDFDTYEAFEEAQFDYRYQKRASAEAANREKAAKEDAAKRQARELDEWSQAGENKYPDFKQVAQNDSLAITPFMAGAIQESPIGHDVAYYLGQNPKEAARIAKLSPIGQVREIGKLEIKVQTPAQKAITKAPAPTAPVGNKEAPSKKLEDMSYDEYKAYRIRQLQEGK